MWNITIGYVTFYQLISYFIIFSIGGWIWESCYVSFLEHKIVNRGYVTGPVCTIYGVGAVSVFLILKPISNNPLVLFLCGIFTTTLLEYVTAVVMETLFHTSWWDYTMEKFNYKGRICLKSSLAWGVASLALFKFIIPIADKIIALFTEHVGQILIICFGIIYTIDFVIATIAAVDISEKIKNIESMFDDFEEYLKSTRLYTEGEGIRDRITDFIGSRSRINYLTRYSKRFDVMQAVFKDSVEKFGSKYSSEVKDKLVVIASKYNIGNTINNVFIRRIMNAYPNIKSRARFIKQRDSEKIQK